MHILYILDFYKPNLWWIEVLLDEIIFHFGKENKVSVITWNFSADLLQKEIIWNITIYRVNAKNLISYVFQAMKLWKKVISDVDIIHANNFYSAIVGSKLAKKYNKKSVLHIHWFFWQLRNELLEWNFLVKKLKVWKFQLLEKLNIYWNFDKYICVSKYVLDVARFYYGIWWEKLELVYNWLDYKKWLSYIDENKIQQIQKKYDLEDNFSLLFYWRIEKVKWWDLLLEVLSWLDFKLKVLFIVHWDLEKFNQKILELWWEKKENKIILNNVELYILEKLPHSEIWNYIKSVSAVVFPSTTESFGYVALETSILNTPLIASNGWAIPEVAYWKVNFFDIKNKSSFQKAIEATKQWVYEEVPEKDFDIKTTIDKIEKVYKELVVK